MELAYCLPSGLGKLNSPKEGKPGEFLCHTIFKWDIQGLRNAKWKIQV